jgi:hypothetical protein
MNLNVSSLFFEIALVLLPGFAWMKIHTGATRQAGHFAALRRTAAWSAR